MKKTIKTIKKVFAILPARLCIAMMAANHRRHRGIQTGLSYEMRHMPVYMYRERHEMRALAAQMQYECLERFDRWERRLQKLRRWQEA